MAISPNGDQFATTNTAGRAILRVRRGAWEIDRILPFPGFARSVAFSPDGRLLDAGGIGPGVIVWDLTVAAPESNPVAIVPVDRAGCVVFSPDGQTLAVTTDLDGTIVVCDLNMQHEHLKLHEPSPPTTIAFAPGGGSLAAGGRDDGSINIWDVRTMARHSL